MKSSLKVFRNSYIPVSVFSFSSLVISLKASSFDIFWNDKYSAQKETTVVIFHSQVYSSVQETGVLKSYEKINFTRIYSMSQKDLRSIRF